MSSINKVMLLGRLGKDPESRNVNGKTVANFSLATSEKYTDKTSGEKKEITEWTNVVVWGGPADVCVKYVKKGHLLFVEGKLRTRSWEKEGVRHYTTEVVAHEVQLMPNEKPTAQPTTYTPPPATADPFAPAYTNPGGSDDLPF